MTNTARIVVDPSRPIGAINPNIYGQFLSRRRWVADQGLHAPGHVDAGQDGLRREVVDAIAPLQPSVIRWPGGCTGTSYRWLDGIGPPDGRDNTMDAHFGYGVSNQFGTAEFIEFCRQVGAEPQINLTTGMSTMAEAMAWVEYCNADTDTRWANLRRTHGWDEPFGVKYWQIGNEEWGDWEIGQTSATDYAHRAREWAKVIKRIDPEAKVLALGHYLDHDLLDWNIEVLRTAGPHLDYLTLHRYWDFNSKTGDDRYEQVVGGPAIEEAKIVDLGALVRLVGRENNWTRRPELAFTEWNARDLGLRDMTPQWRPGQLQYRLVDALAVAGFLHAMQRQCQTVTLANLAQSINVVGLLVVTDDQVIREPIYWALHTLRHHSGDTAVGALVECEPFTVPGLDESGTQEVPSLDVSATTDSATGRCCVSIVNRSRHDPVEVELVFAEAATGPATQVTLSAPDPLAVQDIEAGDLITPVTETLDKLPPRLVVAPHSHTVFDIDP